jgi:hypothetical protein
VRVSGGFLVRKYQSSASDFGHIQRSAQATSVLATVVPTTTLMGAELLFLWHLMS